MADHGDPDVNAERYRTLHGSGRQDLLRITNLSKVYRTRKLGSIRAVDKLTFAIPTGEVTLLYHDYKINMYLQGCYQSIYPFHSGKHVL